MKVKIMNVKWNKVNLRAKDKNLPEVGKRVVWATTDDAPNPDCFHKFVGILEKDMKHINYEYGRYKVTSNYWWCELDDPNK